jgi:predicted nucleotidyltransferase
MAQTVAAELAAREDVLAVLIGGSVARGEHQPSSDVDLVIVCAGDSPLPAASRSVRGGLVVEALARTESAWAERFDRSHTSWLYPFLEGEVVYDTGPAARLAALATATLANYRTPAGVRSMLAAGMWNCQAKLERAAISGDPRVQGFWVSLLVEPIVDGLYAIHDVPRAAGSRRLAYLHRLDLTDEESRLLDTMLTGDTLARFDATRELVAWLRERLGPPDLEAL